MVLANRRRSTAAFLVLSLFAFAIVGPVAAGDDAVFSGKVYMDSAATPEAGVVVTLVGPSSDLSFSSSPSDEFGTFRVEGAAVGSYRVVAETPRGAFLAADAVELAPGVNRPVALTLDSDAPSFQTEPGTPAAGSGSGSSSGSGGLPTWAKWTIVGGIAVLALLAIDEVTKDEDPGSGFNPN